MLCKVIRKLCFFNFYYLNLQCSGSEHSKKEAKQSDLIVDIYVNKSKPITKLRLRVADGSQRQIGEILGKPLNNTTFFLYRYWMFSNIFSLACLKSLVSTWLETSLFFFMSPVSFIFRYEWRSQNKWFGWILCPICCEPSIWASGWFPAKTHWQDDGQNSQRSRSYKYFCYSTLVMNYCIASL